MLFTFPSRYLFTIGLSIVFSLAGWSRLIQTGFLVSRLTQDTTWIWSFTCTGLSPPTARLSNRFHFRFRSVMMVLQPQICLNKPGLGCFHFARHYSGNHFCFLFLRVLRCFSSPGLPNDYSLYPDCSGWVAPFGYSRIKGYLHLPVTFRSLSRPSSP